MNGTKGMAGFTLYPGKAYIEVKAKLYNRNALPNTFLWWANPAVAVNDHYQSVFPPDVHAVYDHGRRDVSAFPIATGVYYKTDYAPGTDISRYKNIPVPTSYMAVNSAADFIGGYEHDAAAGMLHVANHHISPGKKQWTWGNGDFGRAWDRNLTDENGPYVELMTGVYTDNQPDFSWLMPYEIKTFEQYFLPYRKLGLVKAATNDLALALEIKENKVFLQLFGSSDQSLLLQVNYGSLPIQETTINVSPEQLYQTVIQLPDAAEENNIEVKVCNIRQQEVLRYRPDTAACNVPEAAKAPLPPEQVADNELLFLTGLHLEQYRHATFDPTAYYQEALRRNTGDVRCNNAMGLWLLRRGKLAESEPYFRKAISTLTRYNANPYDGEPYYNLGCCLQWQQRWEVAYDAFYKASWNNAWQAGSFFALAQIDTRRRQFEKALRLINQSLNSNAANNKAIALKAAVLRYLQQYDAAMQLSTEGLLSDPFNLSLYFEQAKLYDTLQQPAMANKCLQQLAVLARGEANNFIEYANDYAAAGLHAEAMEWLGYGLHSATVTPLLYYYLAWNAAQLTLGADAAAWYEEAATAPATVYFPNRLEDIIVLGAAISANPSDAQAFYLLGCQWFNNRQYTDAIACWQQAAVANATLPAVWRNLGIAFYNKKKDSVTALHYFEKAFELDTNDARILMELDQLYKRTGKAAASRLTFLEQHLSCVLQRDDLYIERVAIYNYLGDYETAYKLIMDRHFHPWEGGEGKVAAQYKQSLVQMALQQVKQKHYQKAIDLLSNAQVYPHNLGEGKLPAKPDNDIFYFMGIAYEAMYQVEKAVQFYRRATVGDSEPAAAIFYNDPQPEGIFYQGLAWEKLQESTLATDIFERLISYGAQHLHDTVTIDFFAVSLPDLLVFDDDLDKRNTIHCNYMMALGWLGKKDFEQASRLLDAVAAADAMHQGAKMHAQLLPGMVSHP